MSGDKVIKVDPPKPGQKDMSVDLSACDDGKKMTVATEKDVQLYYYVLGNTLKNYKMYKENPHVFRNSCACDKCYQVFNVSEGFYGHKDTNITLCSGCWEDNCAKDNYTKLDNEVNPITGLRF